MVDADAAVAAAQKLADQFASQADATAGDGDPAAENGEQPSHKRKLEDDDDDASAMRKRASFNGPQDGEQAPKTEEDAAGAKTEGKPEGKAEEGAGSDPPEDKQPVPTYSSEAAQPSGPVVGPTGEMTETIMIPSSMTGKLIGKSGETIRQIQNSTGTRVQIDHNYPGDQKAVTVTAATADAVIAARQQIEQITSDEPAAGETQKTVDCPQGIVGRIIGRGGETIRALQQASQAHILVDQNFPEGQPRKITISGRADAVERASKMVEELISGEPGSAQAIIQKYGAGVTKVVECQKGIVGRIIGKGGETIKMLQKNFACNIQIDQSSDPMRVNIAGQPQNVESAAFAVQEIIQGGNPLGGPGGFGGAVGPRGPAGFGGGFGGPAAYGGFGYGGYGAFPQAAYGGFPGAYGQGFGGGGSYGGYGGFGGDPYGGGGGGGYGGGGGGGGGGSVWQELQDDQGRSYYYNTQTGVSQWEKPDGFSG